MPSIWAITTISLFALLAGRGTPPATQPLPADEQLPAAKNDCFPGAIYRKAVSSMDVWTGIDGIVVLPAFNADPSRLDPTRKPLDNPSIYLGGRAGVTEIDAGVNWEVIREPDGTVSTQRKAYRPFWRNAVWASGPARPDMYFYPGDTIRMACWTTGANKLRFRVELLARANAARPAMPISFHEAEFDAPGFGPGKMQQFKRVNAIDQRGNEGKPVQPTAAKATNARWLQVDLLRGDQKRPLVANRFTDMRCPNATLIRVTPPVAASDVALGAEKIDLMGR